MLCVKEKFNKSGILANIECAKHLSALPSKKAGLFFSKPKFSYNRKGELILLSGLIDYERPITEQQTLISGSEPQLINNMSILSRLRKHLASCGHIKRVYRCKNCNEPLYEENEASCEVRYCKNPGCIEDRFKKTIQSLKAATKKKTLLHFTISFKTKQINNLKTAKKQLERKTNFFFAKLRKGNPVKPGFRKTKQNFTPILLKAIKVFDLKKTKEGYMLHYHFAVISKLHLDFAVMQQVRKQMLKNAKNKWAWHLQFHLNKKRKDGRKAAHSVLSYMAKRAIGIYGKSDKYSDPEKRKIKDIIKDSRIYTIADLMSIEQYAAQLYNSRFLSGIGLKILYTCNVLRNLTNKKCPKCGFPLKKGIKIEIYLMEISEMPPPPQEPLKIEYIWFNSPIEKFAEHIRKCKTTLNYTTQA